MRTNTTVLDAFKEGKPKRSGANESTGKALFYHGNKIAEWKDDALFISNGGYTGNHGETGSSTTKQKLNYLPKVNLTQKNFKWFLNGEEWNGKWIKINVTPPSIEESADFISLETRFVSSGGYRGYTQPVYAVGGANNTGNYSDSPCPSDVCESEINAFKALLKKEGIKFKEKVCETTNVFCVHVYVVVSESNHAKALEIAKKHQENSRLFYACETLQS